MKSVRKYVRVKKTCQGFVCRLVVGVQDFEIFSGSSKKEAEWMAKMLRKALINLVAEVNSQECKPCR